MILGPEELFMQVKADLMKQLECDDCGQLKKYVGNMINYVRDDAIKFFWTVLLQSATVANHSANQYTCTDWPSGRQL